MRSTSPTVQQTPTTTHKLQGQTLNSLTIDLGGERHLSSAYVAFTRSKASPSR